MYFYSCCEYVKVKLQIVSSILSRRENPSSLFSDRSTKCNMNVFMSSYKFDAYILVREHGTVAA